MSRHLLAFLAILCLLLAGCGSSQQAAKYRVVVVPKGNTHEFWQSIKRGAERAADDLKAQQNLVVDVVWDGPLKESDAIEQIGIIDRNIGAGVSGIVLAPQDSKQMVAPVERALQAKIPVVIIDSGLANPDLIVKYVATDNYNGGKLAGEHLLKTLAAEGKTAPRLVLFRYAVGSESTEQREKGFEDAVKAAAEKLTAEGKPGPKIVSDDVYAGATVDTAERAAGPLLNRLGKENFDGIFAVNESAATGVMNALRTLNWNKQVKLMAFDSSDQLRQGLKEGDVIGTIVQDPYRMGYLGVWVLVHHLEGYKVDEEGKNLSTGEYVLTPDGLNKTEARERFEPALQKQRKIVTPTFKK